MIFDHDDDPPKWLTVMGIAAMIVPALATVACSILEFQSARMQRDAAQAAVMYEVVKKENDDEESEDDPEVEE